MSLKRSVKFTEFLLYPHQSVDYYRIIFQDVQEGDYVNKTQIMLNLSICENLAVKLKPLCEPRFKHIPDVNSYHVFTVGLLNHVVDGVAADKRYIDVVSRYDI